MCISEYQQVCGLFLALAKFIVCDVDCAGNSTNLCKTLSFKEKLADWLFSS